MAPHILFLQHYMEWLRHCATSQTVLGSIPGGVTGFFPDLPMEPRALVSTPPLKMSTRDFFWGKVAGA